jgi:hypothetical protein
MTINRQSLTVREGMAPHPALREGVPEFVQAALRQWIFQTASLSQEAAKHALIRFGLKLPSSYRRRYAQELEEVRAEQARLDAEWQTVVEARRKLEASKSVSRFSRKPRRKISPSPADPYARFLAEGTDATILWDVADDLLYALCSEPLSPDAGVLEYLVDIASDSLTTQIIGPLRTLLEESQSVYEIRPDRRGLRRRIDPVLVESVNRTGECAEAAGREMARVHLIKARDKLFDVRSDPGAAYVEMILAVEEVACPLFLPADPMPTLGKVRGHLRDAGEAYQYILPGKDQARSTAGVIGMLTDLREGHSDRHGGGPRCVPVSREAGEVAFTLTVSLVTIFSSDAVRRRGA